MLIFARSRTSQLQLVLWTSFNPGPVASLRLATMQRSQSDSAIVAPQLPGWRLPREGAEDGGGRMQVMNRSRGDVGRE